MSEQGAELRDELEMLELIAHLPDVGRSEGEVFSGDDAAVLVFGGAKLLVSTDTIVEGVHFRRSTHSLEDVAWKAVAVNVSDIAAMGGEPFACVVAVSGGSRADLERLIPALHASGLEMSCPVVGGDISAGRELVVTASILGRAPESGAVLRTGARPGESVFVTAPLGRAAAGLRMIEEDRLASGDLAGAQRRPIPRAGEGAAAARAGATAMIDVSDGFGIDLGRIAAASKVGVALEALPVAPGATRGEALGGGEDYELVFTAPDADRVLEEFSRSGLSAPLSVGRTVADRACFTLCGQPLGAEGFVHRLG